MPAPLVVVVDASIAVKWVLVEEDSDRATVPLQYWIQANARLVVPPHFFVECAAVLQKRVRRAELSRQEALGLFLSLQATELTVHGDPLLSHQALDAAGRYGLASAYDAHYVALANSTRRSYGPRMRGCSTRWPAMLHLPMCYVSTGQQKLLQTRRQ